MDLSVFTQQFINALTLGAIYALIALGYTMVYGIIELINFAHGDVFMVGAFIACGRSPCRWPCTDLSMTRSCWPACWSSIFAVVDAR